MVYDDLYESTSIAQSQGDSFEHMLRTGSSQVKPRLKVIHTEGSQDGGSLQVCGDQNSALGSRYFKCQSHIQPHLRFQS